MKTEDKAALDQALNLLLDEHQISDTHARAVALTCGEIGAGVIDASWAAVIQEVCRCFGGTAASDATLAPGLEHAVRALDAYLVSEFGRTGGAA